MVLVVTAVMSVAAMGLLDKVSATILGLAVSVGFRLSIRGGLQPILALNPHPENPATTPPQTSCTPQLTKLTSTLGALSWVVRQSAELENSMISVERMSNYARTPSEEEVLGGAPRQSPRQSEGGDPSEAETVVIDKDTGGLALVASKAKAAGSKAAGSKAKAGSKAAWPWGDRGKKMPLFPRRAAKGGAGGAGDGKGAEEAGARPPPGWPDSGAVKYEGVVARYRPGLRPVLVDVTFELKPGEMMGVVSLRFVRACSCRVCVIAFSFLGTHQQTNF
jgi:ABC-type multidrug transport system fused ATPase/permease subunit